MYEEEFKDAVFHREDCSYTIKTKFDSGTTVEMVFWISEYDIKTPSMYIEVALHTYTKRRQVNAPEFFYSIKGKDGLRPAIWATNLLLKFPYYLLSDVDFRKKNEVIYTISWSDSRRRDVYHKWLSRHGFYFDHISGYKCLTKSFSRPEKLDLVLH